MQVLDTVDLDAIRALHAARASSSGSTSPTRATRSSTRSASCSGIPDWPSRTARSSASARSSTTTASACCSSSTARTTTEPVEVHVHISGSEVVHHAARRVRATCAEARDEGACRRTCAPRRSSSTASSTRWPDSLRILTDRYDGRGRAPRGDRLRAPKPADRRRMCELRAELFRLAADRRSPQREMLERGGDLIERCPASSATSRATPSATSTTTSCVTVQPDRLSARGPVRVGQPCSTQPDGRPADASSPRSSCR